MYRTAVMSVADTEGGGGADRIFTTNFHHIW